MKLIDKLIHTIVPHQKHGNIPHLLQAEFVGILSFIVVALFVVNQNNFAIIRGLNLTGAIYPAVIADLTNTDRASLGLGTLRWNPTLEEAAREKAQDMADAGYFAHTSPTGITPWYWLDKVNYNFIYAGENLAIDFSETEKVQKAWLNSPTHRANILNEHFTEMGVFALDGSLSGRPTTFVVEFFGKPAKAETAPTKSSTPAPEKVATSDKSTAKVAGATAESVTTKTKPTIRIIQETSKNTEKYISAENLNASEEIQGGVTNSINQKLASWYMHLAVSPTAAIRGFYELLIGLVSVAMMLILTKEYKKHHTKHLVMGLLLLALTGALFFIIKDPSLAQAFF